MGIGAHNRKGPDMNPQYHNNTRSPHWQIPLKWGILGILCVGTTNATVVPGQSHQSDRAAPLNLGGEAVNPGLISNPVGMDLLLEILVNYLILILDAPLDDPAQLNGSSQAFNDTTDTLILGYPFFGLDPDLTNSEIEYGLDDAYTLIDILEKNPDDINLDEDTQFELKATAEAIIKELEDGE